MNFKTNIKTENDIYDAGFKRVSDIDHYVIKSANIDGLVKNFINSISSFEAYIPSKNNIFISHLKNTSIKDLKFYINLNNVRLGRLESEIDFYIENTFSLLKKIQEESLALESELIQSEIKYFEGTTNTHYNDFTKTVDVSISGKNKDFFIDHKTKFGFKESETLSLVKGLGLLMPIENKVEVPISDVIILNEFTTTGDTIKSLKVNNPINTLKKNKVFEFSGIFKSFDKKYSYKRETATLSLALQLNSSMPVNMIEINPASGASFAIEELLYIDNNGFEVNLLNSAVENNFKLTFYFSPVVTRTIILKLKQKTIVGSSVVSESLSKDEEMFASNNFLSKDRTEKQRVEGNVFDLSINDIGLYLIDFKNRGMYKSQSKEISNCVSFNILEKSTIPSYNDILNEYYKEYLLLMGSKPFVEKYIGLKVFDKNKKVLINDIIPVPDDRNIQREYLEPIGKECRFKLFPLLRSNKRVNKSVQIDITEICKDIENEIEPIVEEVEIVEPIQGEEEEEEVLDVADVPELEFGPINTTSYVASEESRSNIKPSLEASEIDMEIALKLVKQDHQERLTSTNTATRLFATNGSEYGVVNAREVKYNGISYSANIYQRYQLVELEERDSEGNKVYDVYFLAAAEDIPVDKLDTQSQTKGAVINLSSNVYNGVGTNINTNLIGGDSWKDYWNGTDWQEIRSSGAIDKFTISTTPTNVNLRVTSKSDSASKDEGSYRQQSSPSSRYTSTNISKINVVVKPQTESTPLQECDQYYIFTFAEDHSYLPGDIFKVSNPSGTFTIEMPIDIVVDARSIAIKITNYFQIPSEYLGAFATSNFNIYSSSTDIIKVYENEKLLVMGKDYYISLDNGSNYYYSIPQNAYTNKLEQKCKAGDFLVKVLNPDHSKIYHCEYKVKPNQFLTKDRKVLLKNLRVKLLDPLDKNEGIVESILILRKGFRNKYLSPLIYEYSLNIFEVNPKANKRGSILNKSLNLKTRRSTLNVN